MSKISIIIPTYNAERTIKKALQSIIGQTYQQYEVLIIDGGSQDRTLAHVRSFRNKRVKICSGPDKGVYDAMNKGIDLATGEWLYFLGSDDELRDNDVLSNIATELQKDDADFVYGDAWFLKSQGKHIGEVDRKKLMTQTNICHQAIFYKKDLFKQLGKYNLAFKIWADWDFNIRCFSHPNVKIKYIDLIVANYNDFDGLSARLVVDDVFVHLLSLDTNLQVESAIKTFKRSSFDYQLGRIILKLPRKLVYLANKLIRRR